MNTCKRWGIIITICIAVSLLIYIVIFMLVTSTATLAETLARLDAQLAEWDAKIAKEQNSIDRAYLRNDKTLCVWSAAQTAVRAGAYDATIIYLKVMEDFGRTEVSEEGKKKKILLRKLMENPNSIPIRIEFANGLCIDNLTMLGVGYASARDFLIKTLKLRMSPDQRLQVYQLIQQYSIAVADTTTAIHYNERICTNFKTKSNVCDQSLFTLAHYFNAQGQLRKASETLQRILTIHPESELAGIVHLGLSEVFASLGDEAKMVEYLELTPNMPPKETHRNIIDSSDNRQVALVRLGKYYQGKNEFAKALEYFRA